ncbi:MAG: hypothetical protein LAP87_18430 [Acidobacteriia bacterium]|nr:hypothetical protein [Terriglobia bacterium]
MEQVVVLAGVQGRQHYMTMNNRLRQAVGSSKLMDDAIKNFAGRVPAGDLLYEGGGNAAAVYPDREAAKGLLGAWSRQWLEAAPEIRLAAAIEEFKPGGLCAAWDKARAALGNYEDSGSFGCELGYLPVTDSCPDTGRAAQTYSHAHGRKSWISLEALKKDERGEAYSEELNAGKSTSRVDEQLWERVLQRVEYRFPIELDDLGLRDSDRHIAVVHCDGNGIGALFNSLKDKFRNDDKGFSTAIRELSVNTRLAGEEALVSTFERFSSRLHGWFETGDLKQHPPRSPRPFFPARMLVSAGDDFNWICEARLGLASAARFCLNFEQATAATLGTTHSACAGVAIVPVGFPYRRAYELAAELCSTAKRRRRKLGDKGSYMDFHAVMEGSARYLETIRQIGYRGDLDLGRPLRVTPRPDSPKGTWDAFCTPWRHFRYKWRDTRSRIKRLLEEVAASSERGAACVATFAPQGYELPEGYSAEECFSALELYDLFLDVDAPVTQQEAEYAAPAR